MFNHEARWDRKLPVENEYVSSNPIAVTCIIEKGKILPKSFSWNKKIYDIERINFFWMSQHGKEDLMFFSVKTKYGNYQIAFSKLKFSWNLDRLPGPP